MYKICMQWVKQGFRYINKYMLKKAGRYLIIIVCTEYINGNITISGGNQSE